MPKSLQTILFTIAFWLPLPATAKLKDGHYFQAIATNTTIQNDLWYLVGDEKKTIFITKTMRSIDYAYDAGSPFIYFYGNRIDAEGKPIPEAVAKVPSDATRLLLLFNKLEESKNNTAQYNIVSLKDDSRTFAFGSFKLINASSSKIAMNLGEHQFFLDKGMTKVIQVEPPERGDLTVKIIKQDEGEAWASNYTNGWGHQSNRRTLVFIVDGPNGRVKPRRYRQTEPTQ